MKQKPEQDSNLQKYIDSVDYEPRTKEEIRGAAKEVLRIVNSKKSDVSKTSHFLEPPVHRNYILKYSIAASITFLAVSTLLWYAFMGQNNEQKTLTEVKKQSAPPNAQVEKKSNADQAVILDSFNYSVQIRSFSMTNGKKSIAENSQADLLINEFKRNFKFLGIGLSRKDEFLMQSDVFDYQSGNNAAYTARIELQLLKETPGTIKVVINEVNNTDNKNKKKISGEEIGQVINMSKQNYFRKFR